MGGASGDLPLSIAAAPSQLLFPDPLAVIDLSAFGSPGNGLQLAPGLPLGPIQLPLLLFGALCVGDEFFHFLFLSPCG